MAEKRTQDEILDEIEALVGGSLQEPNERLNRLKQESLSDSQLKKIIAEYQKKHIAATKRLRELRKELEKASK